MGRKKDSSSESDEDSNVRHDRFRPERFKDSGSNSRTTSSSKFREYSSDKHSSKKYRERSPHKIRPDKDYSSKRKESRNRHCDIEPNFRSNKAFKRDLRNKLSSQTERKHSDNNRKKDDSTSTKSSSKKLSSILMNFDKKIESKRLEDQIHSQIGPALPPNLLKKSKEGEELNSIDLAVNTSGVGQELPSLMKINSLVTDEDSDNESGDSQSNNVVDCKIKMNFDKKIESKRLEDQIHSQIGPALPPNLLKKSKEGEELNSIDLAVNTSGVGQELPSLMKINSLVTDEDSDNESGDSQSNNVVDCKIKTNSDKHGECESLCLMGPALPPHLKIKNVEDQEPAEKSQNVTGTDMKLSIPVNDKHESLETFGPALPPKVENDSYGPALPPNLKKNTVQGPLLPLGMTSDDLEKMAQEESDSEDTFGPLPVGKMNMTQYQLDLRAMDIKKKLEEEKSGSSKDINKREEWMLELPPEKASNLGLGPRSFRMKEGPDMSNRSSWTDTPAEKKRKEEMALRGETEPVNSEEIMRTAFVRERNETMDKISKLSKDEEDRQKSLLEMHQKKLKKKKKKEDKEGKKKERRPFDRNIDLQVHRFDEAQKKAIFKKAQLLDTRFSSGESKYL